MDVEMHGGGLGSPLRSAAPSLFAESPLRNGFGPMSSPIPLFQPSPQRSKRARLDPAAVDGSVARSEADEPGSTPGTSERQDDFFFRQASLGTAPADPFPASEAKPDMRFATGAASKVLAPEIPRSCI